MGKKEFQQEIKRRMYILGYDRKSLADQAGIPVVTLDGVIGGRVLPTARTATAIAEALEMDPRDFRAMAYDAQQTA